MLSLLCKVVNLLAIISTYSAIEAQFSDGSSGFKAKIDRNESEPYYYETAEYRLINPKYGSTCILIKANISVKISDSTVFLPKEVNVHGDCKVPTLVISWENNELKLNFVKTMGGERWYMDSVQLAINKSSSERKVFEYRHEKEGLMVTPVGKSYSCEDKAIDLKQIGKLNLKAEVILRKLQIQPFMYKSEYFEPKFECENEHIAGSENAQIAVGSTLAVTVLITISGYALWRHLKVKNVQYDSIE